MLALINILSNGIVFAATFWALLSPKVPTRTGGSLILMAIAFGAFGNMVSIAACHSEPEVLFNVAIAATAARLFWVIEAKIWMFPGQRPVPASAALRAISPSE